MLQKEKKVLQSKKKVLEKGDAYAEGTSEGGRGRDFEEIVNKNIE